jgi:hypothetical protein
MNSRFDNSGARFAETSVKIADRIRRYRPEIAAEYEGLAIESLRDDRRFKRAILWQDWEYSKLAPKIRAALDAGEVDPLPAIAFLEAHEGAASETA